MMCYLTRPGESFHNVCIYHIITLHTLNILQFGQLFLKKGEYVYKTYIKYEMNKRAIDSLTSLSYLKTKRNSSSLRYLKYLKRPPWSCACCPRSISSFWPFTAPCTTPSPSPTPTSLSHHWFLVRTPCFMEGEVGE